MYTNAYHRCRDDVERAWLELEKRLEDGKEDVVQVVLDDEEICVPVAPTLSVCVCVRACMRDPTASIC